MERQRGKKHVFLVETSKMTRTRGCGSSRAMNSRQLEFGKDRIAQPAFFSITRWTGVFCLFVCFLEETQTDLEGEYGDRQQEGHSQSTAFRHLLQRKGVINQCLVFAGEVMW